MHILVLIMALSDSVPCVYQNVHVLTIYDISRKGGRGATSIKSELPFRL